jgi:phenylacetate-CoA ligase
MSSLQNVLHNAVSSVPHYQELFDDKEDITLSEFPVISKKAIQRNSKMFLSSTYDESVLLRTTTSGSTGVPLTVHMTKSDKLRRDYYESKYRMDNWGIMPGHNFCQFSLLNTREISIIREKSKIAFNSLCMDEDDLRVYYDNMANFAPIWLFGTPSSVLVLAKYIMRKGLVPPKSLKLIELAGEFLFESQRIAIESAFSCKVINHYGCTEIGSIAMECPNGHLHCLAENVHLEVLDHEFVITGFNSTAMPFIRYRIGDRGRLTGQSCLCGNPGQVIEIEGGRTVDFAYINGEAVNSAVYFFIIKQLNEEFKNVILRFQITQLSTAQSEVSIELSVRGDILEWSIKQRFIALANKFHVGCLEYIFVYPNEIKSEEKKFMYFSNNLPFWSRDKEQIDAGSE